jgi:hypothetical protein
MRTRLLAVAVLAVAVGGLVAVCSGATGGGKKAPPPPAPKQMQYYFNVVSSGWNVQLFMNGQPVKDTRESGFVQEVGPFVVSGKNTVRIVADSTAKDTTERTPCDVRFGRVQAGSAAAKMELIDTINEEGPGPLHVEKEFTFQAATGVRWTWQDAEPVGTLTAEDRKAILAIIAGVVEDYRKRDFKAIESKRLPLASGGKSDEAAVGAAALNFAGQAGEAVRKYDDYTTTAADPEKFRFTAGTQMVLVRPGADGEMIVRGGHAKDFKAPDGVMVYSIGQSEMRFIRKDGKWCWLGS